MKKILSLILLLFIVAPIFADLHPDGAEDSYNDKGITLQPVGAGGRITSPSKPDPDDVIREQGKAIQTMREDIKSLHNSISALETTTNILEKEIAKLNLKLKGK